MTALLTYITVTETIALLAMALTSIRVAKDNTRLHNAIEELSNGYEEEHRRCGAFFTLAMLVFKKLDNGDPYQDIYDHMSREMERFA